MIAEIASLLNRAEYCYDNRDRKVAVIGASYTGLPQAQQEVTTFVYDKAGNLLSLTDPVNNTTSYQYDALKRLTIETNELEKSRFYQYDASGNRTQAVDRNGRVRLFEYDALNRMTAEKWLNGATVMKTIASTYDAAGQLIQIGDDVSRYTYDYDLLGRLASVDNAGTPGVAPVKFTYDYDDAGNLISVTDAINDVTQATKAYEYDKLDRTKKITQSGTGVQSKRVDFEYDPIGLIKRIRIDRFTGLNGTGRVATTQYGYDDLNRLKQIQHQNAANAVLEQFDYGYDADARITSITDLQRTVAYNYLADNQLMGANYSDTTTDESYSYDANGNRLGNQTDADNQLRADSRYLYTYDDEGNLKTQTEIATGKVREFVWDYRNRLVEVIDRSGSTVTQRANYAYDTIDQRIAKQVDADGDGSQAASTTRFVYDRNHVALEFIETATTPSQRYLYGVYTDQVLAEEENGVTIWHLADHQGSARALVNNSGVLVNQFTYDPFGKLISSPSGTVDTRYRYTGREWDMETGLHYYRARHYDANIKRFISQDTVGFAAGDTNLYRYVHNNPRNRTDPSGMADTRNPLSFGVVVNRTKRPVYVLVSNNTEDYHEVLHPGQSTPHDWGRSKDVDGVWVHRGSLGWKFFPVGGARNFPGIVVVKEDKCERIYLDVSLRWNIERVVPWNGIVPQDDRTQNRHPSDPANRGRVESRIVPDPRGINRGASQWYAITDPEEVGRQNILSGEIDWGAVLKELVRGVRR